MFTVCEVLFRFVAKSQRNTWADTGPNSCAMISHRDLCTHFENWAAKPISCAVYAAFCTVAGLSSPEVDWCATFSRLRVSFVFTLIKWNIV